MLSRLLQGRYGAIVTRDGSMYMGGLSWLQVTSVKIYIDWSVLIKSDKIFIAIILLSLDKCCYKFYEHI